MSATDRKGKSSPVKVAKSALKALGILRGDILLVLGLLVLSAALGAAMLLLSPEPEYVVITVDGSEVARLPLDTDCVYSIGDTNTIEISGGSVRMIYASCTDELCIHMGSIKSGGQSIVCLPNKVVVSIVGGDDGGGSVDAYTY